MMSQRGPRESQPESVQALTFEPEDVTPRAVGISAAIFFGCIALSALVIAFWLGSVRIGDENLGTGPSAAQQARIPGPRLQTDPAADRQATRGAMENRLASYGWVDREQGIARIPIDEAMRLRAASGWNDTEPQR